MIILYSTEQYNLTLLGVNEVIEMKKNKEKTPKLAKPKFSAFDIAFKVITIALSIATFPVVYFLSLVYIEIGSPTVVGNLIGLVSGCEADVSSITYEKLSIKKMIELFEPFAGSAESVNVWQNEYLRPAIISAIFLALALVIALVIFVTVIIIRDERIIMLLSAIGLVSTIISSIIFTESFAAPIISRDVSISQLIGVEGFLVNLALTFVGRIVTLRLDTGFYAVMFLMVGILAWSFCAYIVNLEDRQKQKDIKKVKKSTKK